MGFDFMVKIIALTHWCMLQLQRIHEESVMAMLTPHNHCTQKLKYHVITAWSPCSLCVMTVQCLLWDTRLWLYTCCLMFSCQSKMSYSVDYYWSLWFISITSPTPEQLKGRLIKINNTYPSLVYIKTHTVPPF